MDKEQTALERLRAAAQMSEQFYHAPLIVTTSGGKDSSVCVALAQRAGINFEVQHNHTTADAPETVRFVREEFKRLETLGIKCTINYPVYKGKPTSMWALIPQHLMPPTRLARYCCNVLKEQGGANRMITTGVRWAESAKRKNRGIYETLSKSKDSRIILGNDNDDRRQLFERCMQKRKSVCNPIIDWTDEDVWGYIGAEKIPVNPLYGCGFKRVGCIGCPLAGRPTRHAEFARYPKFERLYIATFGRMLQERRKLGRLTDWATGIDVFHWWMEDGVLPGQMEMDELIMEDENDT